MKKYSLPITVSFIISETIIWISIIFFRLNIPSGVLHYFSIVLCFIYLLLLIPYEKKEEKLALIAMTFTLIADFFLTLLGAEGLKQILGTVFFVGTQVFLMLRIKEMNNRKRIHSFFPYFILWSVLLILISGVLLHRIDILLFFSISYYTMLLMNMVLSWVYIKKNVLFAFGMLFFVFCDTLVGLSMSGPYFEIIQGTILYSLTHMPINLIWFFYLPSQVLISLSITKVLPFKKIIHQ